MTKTILSTLAIATLLTMVSAAAESIVAGPHRTGKEKRVDNPVDAWMTAVSGPAGKAVTGATFKGDVKTGYRPFQADYALLDATDAKAGQFSVTFNIDKPEAQSAFGFYPGQYISHWALTPKFSLHLWLKVTAETPVTDWVLALYDTAGKRAATDLGIRPSDWSPESSPRTRLPDVAFAESGG